MQQNGRRSAASLAVVQHGLRARLNPPATLGDAEKSYWVSAVNSRPADWFGSEHLPLLVNYCRHAVRADVVAGSIDQFEPDWLRTDEGLRRYSVLLKLARDESTAVNNLARAMRMTHQSLYRADKAATTVEGTAKARPWEDDGADPDTEE